MHNMFRSVTASKHQLLTTQRNTLEKYIVVAFGSAGDKPSIW